MNRMMKKTVSAVLSIAMLASSAVALNSGSAKNGMNVIAAAAYDGPPGTVNWGYINHVTYWEYPNYVYIVGVEQGYQNSLTNVTIPEKINGKSVTGVMQYAFENCKNMQTIKLPRTIEQIAYGAFAGCSKLKELDIPYKTQNIGPCALAGCTSLTKIVAHGMATQFDNNLFLNLNNTSFTAFRGKFYVYSSSTASNFAYRKGYSRVFYKMGDVNNDNRIDATDASQILSAYAKLSTGNMSAAEAEKMRVCADVNRDGSINAVDASAVLTYYAKISTGYAGSFEYFMATR